MQITEKGFDEILKKINRYEGEAIKHGEAALKKEALVVAKVLERNTPKDSDSTNPSHLRDNVVVRMRKSKDGDYRNAYVTYSGSGQGKKNPKDVKWRANFVEWGTIHQRPQAFIYKTAKNVRKDVEKNLMESLRGLLL